MKKRTVLAAVASAAVVCTSVLVTAGATVSAGAADPPPPVTLRMPSVTYGEIYGRTTYLDLRPTLTAGTQPIVITAKRANYAKPIVATWSSSAGSGTLFDGSIGPDWNLKAFYKLVVTDSAGQAVLTKYLPGCLSGEPARRVPSAPARSPYPTSCPFNPFTLGSVQGIQSGWSNTTYGGAMARIPAGDYQVQLSITPRFAKALKIPAAAATSVSTLHVVVGEENDHDAHRDRTSSPNPTPATRPTGERAATAATPKPDLRSLPAWGMNISAERQLPRVRGDRLERRHQSARRRRLSP